MMADGEATLPAAASLVPQETGTPIAKGSIVSFFKGGLAAVRINEDLVEATVATGKTKTDAASETVKSGSPISAADMNFKSDAGTFSRIVLQNYYSVFFLF